MTQAGTPAVRFPRVLIVGQSFNSSTGGGITLSSLFRDWPAERLAVVTTPSFIVEPDICRRYYVLGPQEQRLPWPLSRLANRPLTWGPVELQEGAAPRLAGGGLLTDTAGGTGAALARWRSRGRDVLVRAGLEELVRRGRATPRLLGWADGFAPDLIYSQLSNLTTMRLVAALADHSGAPLVVHFMDDWPSVLYARGLSARPARQRLVATLERLIARATLRLGISEAMCDAYAARYGRPFTAFQNAVDVDMWRDVARREWRAGDPFVVMYRGRVGPGIERSLAEVAAALQAEVGEGRRAVLELHTRDAEHPEVRSLTERFACVAVRAPVGYAEVPRSLAAADLLLLPYDFDDQALRFIRYSMPTKAPEYMASGVPVLVYAPPETALAAYARRDDWGYVVDRQGVAPLRAALATLMDDEALRGRLARRAQEVVRRNHDAAVVRERFREALAAAAKPATTGGRPPERA